MKSKVRVLYISIVISVFSLLLVLITKGRIYDIFLGIFGSSIVTLILSIVEYIDVRRKVLEKYYQEGIVFLNYINKIKYIDNINTDREISKEDLLDSFESILGPVNNFNINEFGNTFSDVYFFLGNKDKKYDNIIRPLYRIVRNYFQMVNDQRFHFQLLKEESGNEYVCKDKLKELHSSIFRIITENQGDYEVKTVYNKISDEYEILLEKLRCLIYDEKFKQINNVPIKQYYDLLDKNDK